MSFIGKPERIGKPEPAENLRQSLRRATQAAHSLLDESMRSAAGWTRKSDYTRFLLLQYSARKPVEAWLARNAHEELCPPAQCPLIAADLAVFDEAIPPAAPAFALPMQNSPTRHAHVLGAAWVLAGSSLGNRTILGELRRTAKTSGTKDEWPARFLSDESMLDFWKHLRPLLETSADVDQVELASTAASAVFDHFIRQTRSDLAGARLVGP